jgi:hypothetical protein
MLHRTTIIAVLLGLLCTLVYLPSLGGPFLEFDDSILITQNPAVRSGPEGLIDIWKGKSLDYYPLSLTLFWIEWHAGGQLSQVFRIVNLVLHLIAAALFAQLLSMWFSGWPDTAKTQATLDADEATTSLHFDEFSSSLTSTSSVESSLRAEGSRVASSGKSLIWFIVAFWMLHPLGVATVAWVAEQKNTLSAVFALGSCIAFTHGLLSNRRAPYFLALLLFALSLLSKAAFVGLPLALLVMIWWRFGRVPRREWIRLSPMVALSIGFSAVAISFQARHVAQIGNDAGSMLVRIVRSGWAVWFYLWKMVVPVGLTPIYPRWSVDPTNPFHWIPLIALIGAFVAIFFSRRRDWIAMTLIGLLLLAPVVGLANSSFFRLSYVADHWTYPALMVFAVAVGYLVSRLPRRAQTPLALAILLILLPLSWRRAAAYHDTLSLWEDAVRKNPTSYAIYNNLAWAYMEAGDVSDALVAAQHAAELAPNEPDVQQTLIAAKRRAEAEDQRPRN